MIEIHNTRVIDAEKAHRRRKTSDSNKTASSSDTAPEKQPSRTIINKLRLFSRRNKKHRKDSDELAPSKTNIRDKKPEAIPQKVVLFESDNEGFNSLIQFLSEKLDKHEKNDTTVG